jgi:DEAD/DEAH box helicase domain-containing protein
MIIYNCEIVKCIPNGARFSEYEYCNGWTDFENMEISVIGFYSDKQSLWYKGFCHCLKPFHDFQKLVNNESVIVGFNSKPFDDNLCKANNINITTTYDLLEEIRITAFGSPRWQDTPKGFSYSLDAIARSNGMAKTGSGALAPQLWQEGKHQEVINYCINDVKLTKHILELGLEGKLVDPNTGDLLKLKPL